MEVETCSKPMDQRQQRTCHPAESWSLLRHTSVCQMTVVSDTSLQVMCFRYIQRCKSVKCIEHEERNQFAVVDTLSKGRHRCVDGDMSTSTYLPGCAVRTDCVYYCQSCRTAPSCSSPGRAPEPMSLRHI